MKYHELTLNEKVYYLHIYKIRLRCNNRVISAYEKFKVSTPN